MRANARKLGGGAAPASTATTLATADRRRMLSRSSFAKISHASVVALLDDLDGRRLAGGVLHLFVVRALVQIVQQVNHALDALALGVLE
jgi:hypothetical protein